MSCWVLPVWTETLAGATVIFVRTGGAVTVMLAVPLTVPLEAVTVKGPPAAAPAVNSPDPLTVPPPLTDQVNFGCGLSGWPNWSTPVAVNCAVLPVWTEALAGATVIVVRTGGAITTTLAMALTVPLVAVTVKGPPAVVPAVNDPDALIIPPPLTDQVNAGCGVIGWPN